VAHTIGKTIGGFGRAPSRGRAEPTRAGESARQAGGGRACCIGQLGAARPTLDEDPCTPRRAGPRCAGKLTRFRVSSACLPVDPPNALAVESVVAGPRRSRDSSALRWAVRSVHAPRIRKLEIPGCDNLGLLRSLPHDLHVRARRAGRPPLSSPEAATDRSLAAHDEAERRPLHRQPEVGMGGSTSAKDRMGAAGQT
jgi:hypothetical protein